jgi:hypothetical protein
MNDSPLELALERLTIPELWQRLGLSGTPRASCRSPFREDKTPSFSIFARGYKWRDHGTGNGGDAVDFVARALDLSKSDAAKKLIELAGTGRPRRERSFQPRREASPPPRCEDARYDPLADEEKAAQRRRSWPAFEPPNTAEIAAIAQQRDLSPESVAIAAARGLLFTTLWKERPAWVVTDSARVNAQVRRIDGEIWEEKDSKAWTLPGSVGGWPVGLREAQAYRAIALVEGGPDLLAAFHLAWCETSTPETLALGKGVDVLSSLGVVAIFGAKTRIIESALPLFASKRVRIFAHDDTTGYGGAATWSATLKAAGAIVDGFGFTGLRQSNGRPVGDLNDFARIDPDQWLSEHSLIESAFDFIPAANPQPPNW